MNMESVFNGILNSIIDYPTNDKLVWYYLKDFEMKHISKNYKNTNIWH